MDPNEKHQTPTVQCVWVRAASLGTRLTENHGTNTALVQKTTLTSITMKTINIKVSREFAEKLLQKCSEFIRHGNKIKKEREEELVAHSHVESIMSMFGLKRAASQVEKEAQEEKNFKEDMESLDMFQKLQQMVWDGIKNPDLTHDLAPGNPDGCCVNGVLYVRFDEVKPLLHQIAIGDYETKDGMHSMKMNVAYHRLLDIVKYYWSPPTSFEFRENAVRAGKTEYVRKLEVVQLRKQLNETDIELQRHKEYLKKLNYDYNLVKKAKGVADTKIEELIEALRKANSELYHERNKKKSGAITREDIISDDAIEALKTIASDITNHSSIMEKAAKYDELYKASRILVEALNSNNVLSSSQYKDLYNIIYR
jgi:hypothetical protein